MAYPLVSRWVRKTELVKAYLIHVENIDRLAHLVVQTQVAKKQGRYELVNLRINHIERNVRDLGVISDQFKAQLKILMGRVSQNDQKLDPAAPKTVTTETEPNDSYKQGVEISSGILFGSIDASMKGLEHRFARLTGLCHNALLKRVAPSLT